MRSCQRDREAPTFLFHLLSPGVSRLMLTMEGSSNPTMGGGGNPNSLRNIYSQDIPKGRPGTFQQDVGNVIFLHFNMIFVPPLQIYVNSE